MSWEHRWTPSLSLAGAALLASLVATGTALYQALSITPEPVRTIPRGAVSGSTALPPPGPTPPALLRSAVAGDPFRPDRQPAPIRFRMPSEPEQEPGASQPLVAIRLIGTAVLPEGRSFAMCQAGTDPPRVVRIGEPIGDYRLREVGQGRALFVNASGTTLDVRVPKAGS